MLNKRGQMSIETLIAIIMGALVLAFVAYGFATNWQMFSSFFPAGNTVSAVVTQCQTSCATADNYGFCTMSRTLKAEDLPNDADGKAQKQVVDTCNHFASTGDFLKYGISPCPSVSC